MDVRFGWSSEYGRQSVAIQLDETDLIRLIAEYAPPGSFIRPTDLTATEAFWLLSKASEMFVEVKVAQKYGGDSEAASEIARDNQAYIRSVLARVNEQRKPS